MQVMENLKKMDASPSQQQQQYLQDAMGRITTDPKALPQIIDFWKGQIASKVQEHNRRVKETEASGIKFPYDIGVRIPDMPEVTKPKNITLADIQATAFKHNMTVQQVKDQLRAKGLYDGP